MSMENAWKASARHWWRKATEARRERDGILRDHIETKAELRGIRTERDALRGNCMNIRHDLNTARIELGLSAVPKWMVEVETYIAAAEAKHPGEPKYGDLAVHCDDLGGIESWTRQWNDGEGGSWQTAILEEACEYARETDPEKRRIELLQMLAVGVRALCAMDGAK